MSSSANSSCYCPTEALVQIRRTNSFEGVPSADLGHSVRVTKSSPASRILKSEDKAPTSDVIESPRLRRPRLLRRSGPTRVRHAGVASADVTGASSDLELTRSGWSQRNRIGNQVAVFGLSDRNFDRWYRSDSGPALLSRLGESDFRLGRCPPCSFTAGNVLSARRR